MTRHRFDFISFLFGALFAGVATWALLSEDLLDFGDIRWIWPAFLVVAGLGLVANIIPGRRDKRGIRSRATSVDEV